jgi:hypothetical protein
MNNKTPIFIAAVIGLFILITSISINSAIARDTLESEYFGGMGSGGHGGLGFGGMGFGGMGFGGMGYGGAGPVIQEPVDTGNPHLDKAINKFYNCLSDTHEDPPTVQKGDDCYHQTVGSNGVQS